MGGTLERRGRKAKGLTSQRLQCLPAPRVAGQAGASAGEAHPALVYPVGGVEALQGLRLREEAV